MEWTSSCLHCCTHCTHTLPPPRSLPGTGGGMPCCLCLPLPFHTQGWRRPIPSIDGLDMHMLYLLAPHTPGGGRTVRTELTAAAERNSLCRNIYLNSHLCDFWHFGSFLLYLSYGRLLLGKAALYGFLEACLQHWRPRHDQPHFYATHL